MLLFCLVIFQRGLFFNPVRGKLESVNLHYNFNNFIYDSLKEGSSSFLAGALLWELRIVTTFLTTNNP